MKLDTEVNPCFLISRLIRSIHFCSIKKLNLRIIVWCKYTYNIRTYNSYVEKVINISFGLLFVLRFQSNEVLPVMVNPH